jgi:hypothetical protein
MSLAIYALQRQTTKTQPEATSRPKMCLCGGKSRAETGGLQTAVQTNGYRHLGRGIVTMEAAPALRWINSTQ